MLSKRLIKSFALGIVLFFASTTVWADGSPFSNRTSGGTAVRLDTALVDLFRDGSVPKTLSDFRKLERQVQSVSRTASSCTVSVQIGPAQGCGVIVSGDGYVLTAAHVAQRPNKRALITLSDGRIVRAMTLGMKRSVDAGLIKIDSGQNNGRPWPHASLGTSDGLKAGMWCVATGHPGGYKADRGPVTRVGRILAVRSDALVTDCALIGGDSGGPLFNLSGRLVAIHSRIGNDVADNLHVPIDHYDSAWRRLDAREAWGFLPGFKPVLGVSGNQSSGVAVALKVAEGSPADKGGIKAGDVIEQFGDVSISDFNSLKLAVAETMPGELVVIGLRRGDRYHRVRVEIGRADAD